MTKRAIPDAVLAQHLAIIGKTGSGKTITEKLCVEQVVADGARVCVLDTTKSDWWGITSSADGKRPGLPFKILGGPHGHVAIHSSAGKAIGQLVGNGKLPLSIIDMAEFEPGGVQRFFVDFAPSLMKHMRGVVYLVIEEAHELAPKERAGFNAENMAIHYAKKLATAGRSKGIRLIVATQRVQSLHNAVLGSCETLIAMRLSSPADQEPISKWLKGNVKDKVLRESIEGSLASLKTGSGWLCSGEAQLFERVHFPMIKTYDNTSTPTGDGKDRAVKTAAVDQDELRTIIGDAVKDAEASDPAKLKAEIARLTGELARMDSARPAKDHQAEQLAYVSGQAEAAPIWFRRGVDDTVHAINQAVTKFGKAEFVLSQLDHWRSIGALPKSGLPAVSTAVSAPTRAPPPARPLPGNQRAELPSPAASGDASLTPAMLETLGALLWWSRIGITEPTRKQLAAALGIAPGGSTMRSRLAPLSKASLIIYPTASTIALTNAGNDLAPSPSFDGTIIDVIRASLTHIERETFDAIPPSPHPITREHLGNKLEIEPSGSTMRSRLAPLSNRELIHYPGGLVARQDWVK